MSKQLDTVNKLYPKTIKTFKQTQCEMIELFAKKQLDYGPGNIAMGTSLDKKEDIDWSLLALSVRINDKVQRLMNLLRNNKEPNNESIEDTLIDLANYSVMSIIVKKRMWNK